MGWGEHGDGLAALWEHRGAPVEMCDCTAMPVNYWRRNGRWRAAVTITATTGDRDAEVYLAGGYDAWMIACPTCRRVFVTGETAPQF